MRDFTPQRIVSAEALAKKILEDRAYYERVRTNTERMGGLVPEIRAAYRRLKQIYAEAAFPSLYFVVGRRNSGGTSSDRALMLGAEMFSDEGSRIRFQDIVPVVVHELAHFQHRTGEGKGPSLLRVAMGEGAADFVAEQLVGRHTNEDLKSYGDSHEHELWRRFQTDMLREDRQGAWLYNGSEKKRMGPPDLGYYMGYKICQAYYQYQPDKTEALRAIIEMRDPEAVLRESRYSERFR